MPPCREGNDQERLDRHVGEVMHHGGRMTAHTVEGEDDPDRGHERYDDEVASHAEARMLLAIRPEVIRRNYHARQS